MAKPKGTLRICSNGHRFYKSSSCPVCPTCESEKGRRPEFGKLSSPANRALENAGIKTLLELSKYSEGELLQLHGIGSNAISTLKQVLKRNGFSLKKNI